jgi:DNA-directed RNA polymerase alpha subunit
MRIADRLRATAESLCELADELDVDVKVGGRRLEDLGCSARCANVFRAERIETIGQLVQRTEIDFRRTPNIGN